MKDSDFRRIALAWRNAVEKTRGRSRVK